MREDLGLSPGCCGAMASHSGKQKRLCAFGFPVIDDGLDDGGDVVDAAASYADRDARARLQVSSERGTFQLVPNFPRYVLHCTCWEMLTDDNEGRELHPSI